MRSKGVHLSGASASASKRKQSHVTHVLSIKVMKVTPNWPWSFYIRFNRSFSGLSYIDKKTKSKEINYRWACSWHLRTRRRKRPTQYYILLWWGGVPDLIRSKTRTINLPRETRFGHLWTRQRKWHPQNQISRVRAQRFPPHAALPSWIMVNKGMDLVGTTLKWMLESTMKRTLESP